MKNYSKIARWCFGELRFFMFQHRKDSARGKGIDKKWFISIGCLWGLQMGRWGLMQPWVFTFLQVGYIFIIKGKVGTAERPLLLSWVDIMLPSLAPPQGWVGEYFCFYMVKPGLSWHYGKLMSSLSTMKVFYFEVSYFYKLLVFFFFFNVWREQVLGVINLLSSLGGIWISYYCFIVLRHVFMLLLLSKHA